ncbi:MAG: hypothetical protein ACTS2F_01850 [Thainema sp.]
MVSLLHKLNYYRQTVPRELPYWMRDQIRLTLQAPSLEQVVNQREIRVLGLRRSGNHAIINWIRHQLSGNIWHLNNIRPDKNPYRVLYQHYPKDHLKPEAWGNFTPKDALIYSYEDYRLSDIVTSKTTAHHDLYLGRSAQTTTILILRDPFNLFASRLKQGFIKVKSPAHSMVDLWLEYAQEFVRESQFLDDSTIFVNYNEWFRSPAYRQTIAAQLNIPFSDAGLEQVKSQGGGSSFDGQALQGRAQEMSVCDRWQHFATDPTYLQLLSNPAISHYSELIFGHIPGTEITSQT